VVSRLAEKHGRTPAQVVLRWHVQLGHVVIPKSVNAARMRENLDVFGFELGEDDMAAIASLDRGERTGPDPDTMG
jgi:diketogulonate reductase-like aldo/keto reductase